MEPLPLLVLGLGLFVAGALYLRSFGPGQRVGRLLASTPRVSVAEAIGLTTDAVPRYVRVDGRLDSDEDFPDERDQPLIFRRRRLEAWRGRRWQILSEARDLVPFQVNEGLDSIGIDGDALGVGLVVLPRESVGAAAEAPGLLPEGLDPATKVRLRVEQVSAVEHATIVGTPALEQVRPAGADRGQGPALDPLHARAGRGDAAPVGRPQSGADGGDPARRRAGPAWPRAGLVDRPDCRRMSGRRRAFGPVGRVAHAACCWPGSWPHRSGRRSPPRRQPSTGTDYGGDTRTTGQGPGLVGSPLYAIGGVGVVALISIGITLVYLRATAGRRDARRGPTIRDALSVAGRSNRAGSARRGGDRRSRCRRRAGGPDLERPAARPGPSVPTRPVSPSASPAGSPSLGPGASTSALPFASPSAGASPGASPVASGPPAAPTSAATFVAGKTIVPMGWPFARSVKVTYGSGFGVYRVGPLEPFNMISGVSKSGALLRGHDGLDLQVPVGTPVLAPFSGTVIDPRLHWIPWDPARYGKVVAIQSDEPTSVGYTVILVHLSSIGAPIGVHVTRGQVVGLTGISGDAAGTIPHLHLELRAPFLIRYRVHGVVRRIDAFDPRPSLLAVDPHRH